jgi:hypothetical protein
MKKIALILMVLVTMFWSSFCFGQCVVTEYGPFVEISEIDSDFVYTESSTLYGGDGQGARIDWIQFIPGSAWATGTLGCYVTIKNGTDTGPTMFYSQACDLGTDWNQMAPTYYNGARLRPVIDFSACSVGHDTSKVIFKIWK